MVLTMSTPDEKQKKLLGLLDDDDIRELITELKLYHPADIAEFLQFLLPHEKKLVFSVLDTQTAADVIVELDDATRDLILKDIQTKRLSEIVDDLESDDAADIIEELPDDRAQEVLDRISDEDAEEIQKLMEYDEESAGGIMQAELASVRENESVASAIEEVRAMSAEVEDIHSVYVTDRARKLVGVLPLRKLILASPKAAVSTVMERDPISVAVTLDQEEVARIVKKYDLVAVPVVDTAGRLVGRITIDDVVDVLEDEATEDIIKLAGATDDEYAWSSSVLRSAGTRLPWLFASWIGGLFVSMIIGYYRDTLTEVVVLAAFMPVIAGMGGNVSAQSSTLVVRGIAIGSIDVKRLGSVLFRELRVGIILGVTYGILLGIVAHFLYLEVVKLWLVVGLGIFASMTIASGMGTLVPIIFHKIGIDPAVASGPFISTTTDIISNFMYFAFATIIILR